jgi:hypothetical protein
LLSVRRDNVNIIQKKSPEYGIQKIGQKHRIVRNIKDFENEKEAMEMLIKLVKGEIREEDLTE